MLYLYSYTKDLDLNNPLREKYRSVRWLIKKIIRESKSENSLEFIDKSYNKFRAVRSFINNNILIKQNKSLKIKLHTKSSEHDISDPFVMADWFNWLFAGINHGGSMEDEMVVNTHRSSSSDKSYIFPNLSSYKLQARKK